MDDENTPEDGMDRGSIAAFLHVEHAVYVAIGVLLAATAIVALGGAASSAWDGVADWRTGNSIPITIERLLFVLMIAEILHTVRISMRSGSLTCEPFLVVGLIASIRRVLVITLETSEGNRDHIWTANSEMIFRSSMIELGVLATLIIVMVFSIFLLQRGKRASTMPSIHH